MTKLYAKMLTLFLAITFLAAPAMIPKAAHASEPFLAEVRMFAGNFAPRGWAFCDGQLLAISQFSAVFSLVGTTYGGDGRTTFGLPDLRGRVAVHPGTGPGLPNVNWGQRSGTPTNTLTTANLPAHNHSATATNTVTVNATNAPGNSETPQGNVWAKKSRSSNYSDQAPDVEMGSAAVDVSTNVTIGNTGSNTPVNNMQPYLGIYHIIALQGIFPSRS